MTSILCFIGGLVLGSVFGFIIASLMSASNDDKE